MFAYCFSFICVHLVAAFNVDFEYTVLKNGPSDSLFGFSVAEHKESSNKWLLVGAPRANNTQLGSSVKTPGTVFKCSATDPSFQCTIEVKFDPADGQTEYELKDNEWMGVSLKSQGQDKAVVTCAHRYMSFGPGSSKNFRLYEGKCYGLENGLVSGIFQESPCGNINSNTGIITNADYYGQCETGIGFDIYPESPEDDVISAVYGTVGALTFTGGLFEKNTDGYDEIIIKKSDDDHNSYFGYSVAIGNYFSKSDTHIASGGPRHHSYGKVLLFNRNNKKEVFQSLPENNSDLQIASGFGAVLCAMDADNNGLSELIVGAPFYAPEDGNDRPDTGAVYVYYKPEGADKLKLQQKLLGLMQRSNFGYAITNAGDLNKDGYNDLVVGAPHENDGQGAVYIFQGSNKGLLNKHTQHIEASTIRSGLSDNVGLKGFGRALAGGMDMDDNGYDDILVGAYISNQAVLLRSRPVVSAFSNIKFTPSEIDISKKNCLQNGRQTTCFDMLFCHNISEPSGALSNNSKTIPIRYSITADPIARPRVLFSSNHDNTISFKVDSGFNEQCRVIKDLYLVYNEDGSIVEYPDITFSIKHDLSYGDGPNEIRKPVRSNTTIPSLNQYPVLRVNFLDGKVEAALLRKFELAFKRECVKCIPNLSIKSSYSNYTLRLGAKTFEFNVTIKNNGVDPAFSVGFVFNLPKDLELNNIVLPNGEKIFCTKNTCEEVLNKFRKDEQMNIGVVLNTREFTPTSVNNISIEVTSANKEDPSTNFDNKIEIAFDIKVVADIQMLAVVSTQQIVYQGQIKGESAMKSLEDAGQLVEHKFAVRNNGPDFLPKGNVTIYWPFETLSGKHLLYLVEIVTSSTYVKCDAPNLNVIKLQSNGSPSKTAPYVSTIPEETSHTFTVGRRRRSMEIDNTTASEAKDKKILSRKKDGVILDCHRRTARCVSISCSVQNLENDQTSSISIISRLWEASLLLDYYGDVLTIVSHGEVEIGTNASYISDPFLDNNSNELYSVITPEFAPKSKATGLKVWQIVLAAIAGIILLALLIFALYKIGFFKRKQFGKSKKDDKKPLKDGK